MLQYLILKQDQALANSSSMEPIRNQIRNEDSTDSGSETDDEAGGPDDDVTEMDFSEGHRTSLRPSEPSFLETGFGTGSGAGSGFRTRPLSTPINAMSALELDEPICDAAWPKTGSETGFGRFDVDGNLFGSNDNDGNHSSEEELEEINNKVELETAFSVVKCQDVESCPTPLTLSSLLSTHAMTSATTTTTPKATPTPMSTDAYFDPPVEFSTSPPVDAHRPRRSKSVTSITTSPLMTSPTAPMTMTSQATPTSMEFPDHKKFFGWTLRKSSTSYQSNDLQPLRPHRERRAISPKKRYKQSRIHHIQRPCLDFEKMQQLKTRAVTNWRHGGGELSLFCW